jgi:hypothetical protein
VRIVVGGYDPSLAPAAYMDPATGADFIVRGEGELTFRSCSARSRRARLRRHRRALLPLRRRNTSTTRTGPRRTSRAPRSGRRPRDARVLDGYTLLGRQVDVVETSRGCTFDCSFCSIIEMRGRNFHTYPHRPRHRRHPRRPRPRGALDLPRGRQHRARRPAVRGALPRADRRGAEPARLLRAGDDLHDRQPRRAAGAADAAGGLPLRLPRHRERAGGGPRVPAAPVGRTPAGSTGGARATPRWTPIEHLHRTGCTWWAG